MLRIILFVLFNIALIVIQVIITQGKSWRYGLIIPIFNSVAALGIALLTTTASVSTITFINGIRTVTNVFRLGGFLWDFSWTLLILSIPAAINFILYFTARNKFNRIEAENLDKMKINDLD
ncbi:MAG TPA: hypothetical protein PLP30_08920 [Clostridia bacterium]|nr:hypothetical protein [Clostridia bacterium]HPQ47476.1 hypothetical protein [Clostridia bacterium]HRX42412.1 hypothetical protein [Clostridia bacterium]